MMGKCLCQLNYRPYLSSVIHIWRASLFFQLVQICATSDGPFVAGIFGVLQTRGIILFIHFFQTMNDSLSHWITCGAVHPDVV